MSCKFSEVAFNCCCATFIEMFCGHFRLYWQYSRRGRESIGKQDWQRTSSRDSNSGRNVCMGTIFRSTAHWAMAPTGMQFLKGVNIPESQSSPLLVCPPGLGVAFPLPCLHWQKSHFCQLIWDSK